MNNIRGYLCAQARRITEASGERFASRRELLDARPDLRRRYLEMMGIAEIPPPEERPPLNVKITGCTEYEAYTIERLHYEALPRLYVPGNLYVPRNAAFPAPGVVYFCGHSPSMRDHYQVHPRRWAELGFVTLIVDTIEYGEMRSTHHGCYSEGWFHWYSRGYTPAGVELWNGIRALDVLAERPEVDAERLGVTGISGGGATSWWVGAADERAKAVAPVCGTGTLRSHLAERTVDGHCDCMFFINYHQWDLADLGALIAPRPLLICSADHDSIYSIESITECYRRARTAYDLLDAADKVNLIVTPGPHSYHETSRKGIFSWFFKHLCGREVPPEEIGDCDAYGENPAPAKDLVVWPSGPPADERSSTVQDWFVSRAAPPTLNTPEEVAEHRRRVVAGLRQTTFHHFPERPCASEYREEHEYGGDTIGRRFSFVPEEGWRLHGRLEIPAEARGQAPVLVYACGPGLGRDQAGGLWRGFDGRWLRMEFEPRGVGETSWGDDLAWHVRRGSAVIGRTVASMRVYDLLRAIEVARCLPESNGTVALAGEGEMAAVALYAALLDGSVRAVILKNPPATQDLPSNRDGTGPALEMLGVLRWTDLPVTAGLLYPTELVFVGGRPHAYLWAEDLYARLGPPGRVVHVKTLREWCGPSS